MSRCVDQIQVINLPVAGLVVQRSGLCLDGDAPFALNLHGVEHLLGHLPVCQSAATVNKAVRKRGFAVINMGNNREITYMLHKKRKNAVPAEDSIELARLLHHSKDACGIGNGWAAEPALGL